MSKIPADCKTREELNRWWELYYANVDVGNDNISKRRKQNEGKA